MQKKELNLECKDCNKSLEDCTCIEDTIDVKQETLEEAKKQQFKYDNLQDAKEISSRIKVVETLEEAAEQFVKAKQFRTEEKDKTRLYSFIQGAKWQQDDILNLLKVNGYEDEPVFELIEEWFEKLEKK